ncbi:hypothetical protein [Andreprevotia chitinilytica]|uniref:hypothetical protein n=1 Tax=Andreprevotia chitinilytica TaxID=396808 RepID=UPI00054F027C|nr:hypothetical protein [Andreprevotia chitinilytica]
MSTPAPKHNELLAFPRRCPQCSRHFGNFAAYLNNTTPVANATPSNRDDGVVEAHRLCSCGMQLTACFAERRRDSNPSLRAQFDDVLTALAELGMPPADVRVELRQIVNGEPDQILRRIYRTAA